MRCLSVAAMAWSVGVSFLAVAAIVCASTVQAAGPVVVEEYTFHYGPNDELVPTNWNTSFNVPLYNGTAPLAEVMITLKGTAESDVTATTTTGSAATILSGSAGALVTASGPGVGLLVDVLPNGDFAPPAINIPGNTTEEILNVMGMDMDMDTITGAGVLPYVGVGTFQVNVDAIGLFQNYSASGGNIDLSQSTAAGAWLTVQYKVMVPEPSTVAMCLLGTLGIAGYYRRRR